MRWYFSLCHKYCSQDECNTTGSPICSRTSVVLILLMLGILHILYMMTTWAAYGSVAAYRATVVTHRTQQYHLYLYGILGNFVQTCNIMFSWVMSWFLVNILWKLFNNILLLPYTLYMICNSHKWLTDHKRYFGND